MTTANQIVNDASLLAEVKADGVTLSAEDFNIGLDALNDMLDSWKNDDVDLNVATPLSSSDTVHVDKSDILAIKYNLAPLISEKNYQQAPGFVIARANELFKSLQAKYSVVDEAEMPRAIQYNTSKFDINSGWS